MAGRKLWIERTIISRYRTKMRLEDGQTVRELCEEIAQYETDLDVGEVSCIEWELIFESVEFKEQ